MRLELALLCATLMSWGCGDTAPPPGCAADGVCNANCGTQDPDCAADANPCAEDTVCNTECPKGTDPDCTCTLDGTCNPNCAEGTDPDCQCLADSVCDPTCPPCRDPDCVCQTGASGVVVPGFTAASGETSSSSFRVRGTLTHMDYGTTTQGTTYKVGGGKRR